MVSRSQNPTSQSAPLARRADRINLGAGALLVSANLCLFGTFEIFSSNRAEFTAGFADVVPFLVMISAALAAVLSLAGWWMPGRLRRMYSMGVVAVGVLLWAQGSFLRWGYGVFDGTGIEWGAYAWQGWLDAAIWIAGLFAAVRYRERIVRQAAFVCVALIVIQSGIMVTRLASDRDEDTAESSSAPASVVPQELCQLSATRNVFHFIMDSFQTDVFLELVREEAMVEAFDGFVVFQENVSTGARTVLAVPSSFSTNVYDGTETESEYFRRATSGSFVFLLAESGYVVNLMPHVTMESVAHTNYYVRGATYSEPPRAQQMRTATYLADVSMFRQFPHFIKRVVYNNQNWRLSALVGEPPSHLSFHQKAFLLDYIDRLQEGPEEPAYHFVHLMPPHPPFVTNPDGSNAGRVLPFTRENYKNEGRYILRLFVDFLSRLKSLGLYDTATILLHGDHGVGMEPRVSGLPTTKRMGKVATLLTIKPEAARGPLRATTAQTSLADIPATLMDLLGIAHPYPGDSIVKIDPSEDRTRRVVFVTDRASNAPAVERWLVRGSVYDPNSWRQLETRKVDKSIQPYEWGAKLNFGIAGNGDSYLARGWSTTSPTLHWNDGGTAEMTLDVKPTDRNVVFELVFFPYIVPGKVDLQRIQVRLNGRSFPAVQCVTRDPRTIRARVPADDIASGRLEFTFEFPDAVSPLSVGEGRDSRSLAIGLYRFETFLE